MQGGWIPNMWYIHERLHTPNVQQHDWQPLRSHQCGSVKKVLNLTILEWSTTWWVNWMINIHWGWWGHGWGCQREGVQLHCVGKLILPVAIGLALATGYKGWNGMGLYAPGWGELKDTLTGMGDGFSRWMTGIHLNFIMNGGHFWVVIPQVLAMQFLQVGVAPCPSVVRVVVRDAIWDQVGGQSGQGVCRRFTRTNPLGCLTDSQGQSSPFYDGAILPHNAK